MASKKVNKSTTAKSGKNTKSKNLKKKKNTKVTTNNKKSVKKNTKKTATKVSNKVSTPIKKQVKKAPAKNTDTVSVPKIEVKKNKVSNKIKDRISNYKKQAFNKKVLSKEENAKRIEELKSIRKLNTVINYKLFVFILVLVFFIVVLVILFNNDKSNEIKLEKINLNSYMNLYKNEDTTYVYITMNNCTYCELLDSYVERLQADYKIKFKTLNISELDEEEMNKLTSSNSVFTEKWKAPILLSIKDGKEISNIKGYKEYGVLKKFVQYSSNPSDSIPFVKISVDKYLNLLNSNELSIIYIGRPDSNGCALYSPILNKVTSEKNLKVYYLNTDILDTTEKWDKLNNSDEIFKDVWFTPTTLIVKDKKIIDYKMESMDEETLLYFFSKNGL